MPLYEYECLQCKKHTEKIQKFSDQEITECPHCGGLLERVVSAAAISFKGGGWFKDGYGNAKPSASSNESEKKGDSGGSSVSSIEASGSSNKEATPTAASGAPDATVAPATAAPSTSSSDSK